MPRRFSDLDNNRILQGAALERSRTEHERMRKWIFRLSLLALIIAAIWILPRTVFAPDPVEVQTVAVDRGRVEATVTNLKAGSVRTRRRARLSPEIGGRIVEIPHREGDRVEKGAILLRLDDTSQKAQKQVIASR